MSLGLQDEGINPEKFLKFYLRNHAIWCLLDSENGLREALRNDDFDYFGASGVTYSRN